MITRIDKSRIEIYLNNEYYIYSTEFNNYYNNVSKIFYIGKISSDIYGLMWVDEKEILNKLSMIIINYFRKEKYKQIL